MRRLAIFFIVFLSSIAILFILIDPTEFKRPNAHPLLPEETGDGGDDVSPQEFEELEGRLPDDLAGLRRFSSEGTSFQRDLKVELANGQPRLLPFEKVEVEALGNDPAAPSQFMLVRGMSWSIWNYDSLHRPQQFAILTAERARIEKTRSEGSEKREKPLARNNSFSPEDLKGNLYFLGPVILEAWSRPPDVDPEIFAADPKSTGTPTRIETSDLDVWSRERRMSTEQPVRLLHGRDRELEAEGVGLEVFGSPFLERPLATEVDPGEREPAPIARNDVVLVLKSDIRLIDRRGIGALNLPGLSPQIVSTNEPPAPLVLTGKGPLSIRDRSEVVTATLPEDDGPPWPTLFWGQLENDVHVVSGVELELWCDRVSGRFRRQEIVDAQSSPTGDDPTFTERMSGHLESLRGEGALRFAIRGITGSADSLDIEFHLDEATEESELQKLELIGQPRIIGLPADGWTDRLGGVQDVAMESDVPPTDVPAAELPKADASPEATGTLRALKLLRLEKTSPDRWRLTGDEKAHFLIAPTAEAVQQATSSLEAQWIVVDLTEDADLLSLSAHQDAVATWSDPLATGPFAFSASSDDIEYRRLANGVDQLRLWPQPRITARLREIELPGSIVEAAAPADEIAALSIERLFDLTGQAEGEVRVRTDSTGHREIRIESPIDIEIQDSEGGEPTHLACQTLLHDDWPLQHPEWPLGRQHTEAAGEVQCSVPILGLTALGNRLEIDQVPLPENRVAREWSLEGAPADLELRDLQKGGSAHLKAWRSLKYVENDTRLLFAEGDALVRLTVPPGESSSDPRHSGGGLSLLGVGAKPRGTEDTTADQIIDIYGSFVSADFGPSLDPEQLDAENPTAEGSLPRELVAAGNVRLVLARQSLELSGELLEARDKLDWIDLHGGVLGRATIRQTNAEGRVLWAQDLSIDLEAERMNLFGGGELQTPSKAFRSLRVARRGSSASAAPVRIRFGRNGAIDRRQARFDGGIELRLPEGEAQLDCEEAVIDFAAIGGETASPESAVRRIEAIGSVDLKSESPRRIRGVADRLVWDVPSASLTLQGGARRVSMTVDDIRYETIPGGTFTLFYLDGGIRSSASVIEFLDPTLSTPAPNEKR